MKILISIPDDLLERAERLARLMKKSRSRLFSDAIKEYISGRPLDQITGAMNQVCAGIENPKDKFVSSAARYALKRSEW